MGRQGETEVRRPMTASLALILVATFAGAPTSASAEELVRFESIPFRAAEVQ
jgi:hypothetical protein